MIGGDDIIFNFGAKGDESGTTDSVDEALQKLERVCKADARLCELLLADKQMLIAGKCGAALNVASLCITSTEPPVTYAMSSRG
jgi:hypothetical protein